MIARYLMNVASLNKKAGHAKESSFGSPAVSLFQDSKLSVPASRRVWLFRGNI
jgi:hypothetical protein